MKKAGLASRNISIKFIFTSRSIGSIKLNLISFHNDNIHIYLTCTRWIVVNCSLLNPRTIFTIIETVQNSPTLKAPEIGIFHPRNLRLGNHVIGSARSRVKNMMMRNIED